MAHTVKVKRSGTASATPPSLEHGELAINYADDKLFWKDSSNVIQSFVFQAYASATHKSTHATGGTDALSPSDIGAAPAASPAITGNATFTASSGVPVTITNTGSGNSFVVEDATSDTTPFVINNSGSVGVGVATPAIPGAGLASIDASGPLVARGGLGVSQTSCGVLEGISGGARVRAYGATAGSGSIEFRTGGGGGAVDTFAATITSDQRLGVGTAFPASRLDVNGVITVAATSGSAGSYLPSVCISGDPNSGFGQVTGQSDTASIFTAGHERVRVDASGNVGIQRSTPTVPLTFSNAVASASTPSESDQTNKIRLYDDGTYQFGFGISTGSMNIAANGGNLATLRFWTDGAERMRITADGKIGLSRLIPASMLDVNGVITVAATSGSAGSYLPSVCFASDPNSGFGQVSAQSDTASIFTAGAERVRVGSTGMTQFFSPISIGIAPAANIGFYNYVSIAGSGSSGIVGTLNLPNITGTTTGDARLYDAACNLNGSVGNLYLFKARASISGTGTVTNEVVGFESENLPGTFGTAQIGFQSKLSSGAGRWNIYAGGAAQNYFAGNVGIGVTVADTKLHVVGGSKFVGPITEGYVSGGNTGSAKTIALTNGTVQAFTLTGNCTFTMPTAVAGQSFTVMLKTGEGSYSATFTGVKWPSNSVPTITQTGSRMDIITFVSDGTSWYGSVVQNYHV
jgi:hypothetical protein